MAIDEELLAAFQDETSDQLRRLEAELVDLAGRALDAERRQRIQRLAHNVKGNAATVGVRQVAELAHAFEDLVEALPEGEEPAAGLVTLALEGVDALQRLVARAPEGSADLSADDRRLAERLRRGEVATAPAAAAGAFGLEHSLRVPLPRLDRMLMLMGEMLVARARMDALLAHAAGAAGARAREAHDDSLRLFTDLQEEVMRARMVPIAPLLRQLGRAVRDAALSLEKKARLQVSAEGVEIDATLIEALRDPLRHLVRNAVDHGLEAPEARRRAGKDPTGTIRLAAAREGSHVVVEVADDGAGLSRERIAQRARELGLHPDPAALDDAALRELVFLPGFSTRGEVTALSGRGIGMDVVRRNVEGLRGSVTLESGEGRGTRVRLRLPLSVAIIDGFAVGVGEQTYVLPAEDVLQCAGLPGEAPGGEAGVVDLAGEALPCVRLREALALGGTPAKRESVVVVRHGGRRAGLLVDVLHGRRPTVVKPLGKLFRRVRGVSATAVESTGRVSLVLDVPQLLADAERRRAEREAAR